MYRFCKEDEKWFFNYKLLEDQIQDLQIIEHR